MKRLIFVGSMLLAPACAPAYAETGHDILHHDTIARAVMCATDAKLHEIAEFLTNGNSPDYYEWQERGAKLTKIGVTLAQVFGHTEAEYMEAVHSLEEMIIRLDPDSVRDLKSYINTLDCADMGDVF